MKTLKTIFVLIAVHAGCFGQTSPGPSISPSPAAYRGLGFPGTGGGYFDGRNQNNGGRGDYQSSWYTGFQTQLEDAYAKFGNVPNQILIGHSQGGMRAFAYASYAEKQWLDSKNSASPRPNNVKAIVSVAGPINGYTPLAGGSEALGKRIRDVGSEILNAYVAAKYCLPVNVGAVCNLLSLLDEAGIIPLDSYAGTLMKEAGVSESISGGGMSLAYKDIAKSFVRGNLRNTGQISNRVIDDFRPESDFFKQWLSDRAIPVEVSKTVTETRLKTPGYWAKVQSGSIWLTRWVPVSRFGITVYKPECYLAPIYIYIYVRPVYETIYKDVTVTEQRMEKPIPANIPIIVYAGTESDVVGILRRLGQDTASIMAIIDDYRQTTYSAFVANAGFAALYYASAIVSGLALQPVPAAMFAGLAVYCSILAANSKKGYDIANDINGMYNIRLLQAGETGLAGVPYRSDAFIPHQASNPRQANGSSRYGGTYINDDNKLIYEDVDFGPNVHWNHITIKTDPVLWGTGSVDKPRKNGDVFNKLRTLVGTDSFIDTWQYWDEPQPPGWTPPPDTP